ncbi:MAG: recombination regulator RecX, partial [Firmicutes bacterium]|nr:recombination regulator RecX [Bacillota bacterium]
MAEGPDGPEALEEARRYALGLLARRPRTRHELETKLASRGYPESVVADVLAQCIEAGYVDDRRFAEAWVEECCRSRPRGSRRLRVELRRRGVSPELVEEALRALVPEEREAELAALVVERHLRGRAGAVAGGTEADALTRRLWGLLRRRGFGVDACKEALRRVLGPREDLAG